MNGNSTATSEEIQLLKQRHDDELKQCKQEMYFWFEQEIKKREKIQKQNERMVQVNIEAVDKRIEDARMEVKDLYERKLKAALKKYDQKLQSMKQEHDMKMNELKLKVKTTKEESTRFRELLLVLGGHAQDAELSSRSLSEEAMQNMKEFEDFVAESGEQEKEFEIQIQQACKQAAHAIKDFKDEVQENREMAKRCKIHKDKIEAELAALTFELKSTKSDLASSRKELQKSREMLQVC